MRTDDIFTVLMAVGIIGTIFLMVLGMIEIVGEVLQC